MAEDLDFGEGAPAEGFILDKVGNTEPIYTVGRKEELLGISGFLKRYFFFRAIGKLDRASVPISIVREIGPYVNDHFINFDGLAEVDFEPDVGAFIGAPGGIFWAVAPVGGVAIDGVFGCVAKLVSTFAITCGVGISNGGAAGVVGIQREISILADAR